MVESSEVSAVHRGVQDDWLSHLNSEVCAVRRWDQDDWLYHLKWLQFIEEFRMIWLYQVHFNSTVLLSSVRLVFGLILSLTLLNYSKSAKISSAFYYINAWSSEKTTTLHSAYSVHFFLIQAVSAKFNTARRTKKRWEKGKQGRGPTCQPHYATPVRWLGLLLHSRLHQNVEQLARATQPQPPLAVNQQQSSPTRRRPMSATTSISLAVADAVWEEIKSGSCMKLLPDWKGLEWLEVRWCTITLVAAFSLCKCNTLI